jgi:hypothetical protein
VSDVDAWIFFDGPEPESLRSLLDAVRDLPPATPEDRESMTRRVLAAIDATLGHADPAPDAPAHPDSEPPTPRRTLPAYAPAAPPPPPSIATPPLHAAPSPPAHPLPPAPPLSLPIVRPPSSLAHTAPALDIPASARDPASVLPFKPASPDAPHVPRTMKLPVWKPPGSETAPIGDDSIMKAVAALPFLGNTVGQGIVPFPRMELFAYVSFRAELAVWPEKVADVLLRYHVLNEASRRALDDHWEKRFAAHPEERVTFEEKLVHFMDHVRSLPR